MPRDIVTVGENEGFAFIKAAGDDIFCVLNGVSLVYMPGSAGRHASFYTAKII